MGIWLPITYCPLPITIKKMQLKKIHTSLQNALIENNLIEANEMQQETFSTIKSGVDAVIQSPKKSGKTTTILMNVIQRMEKPVGEKYACLGFGSRQGKSFGRVGNIQENESLF